MAELIGVISAATSLAEAGFQLGSKLYDFARKVRLCKANVKAIARDVRTTSCILEEISDALKEERHSPVCNNKFLRSTKHTVGDCKDAFRQVEKSLQDTMHLVKLSQDDDSEEFRLRRRDQLRWPFVQPKMELLRCDLDRLKINLQLGLSVLILAHKRRADNGHENSRALIQAHRFQFSVADVDQIRALQKKLEEAETRYDEIRRTMPPEDADDDEATACDTGIAPTDLGNDTPTLSKENLDSSESLMSLSDLHSTGINAQPKPANEHTSEERIEGDEGQRLTVGSPLGNEESNTSLGESQLLHDEAVRKEIERQAIESYVNAEREKEQVKQLEEETKDREFRERLQAFSGMTFEQVAQLLQNKDPKDPEKEREFEEQLQFKMGLPFEQVKQLVKNQKQKEVAATIEASKRADLRENMQRQMVTNTETAENELNGNTPHYETQNPNTNASESDRTIIVSSRKSHFTTSKGLFQRAKSLFYPVQTLEQESLISRTSSNQNARDTERNLGHIDRGPRASLLSDAGNGSHDHCSRTTSHQSLNDFDARVCDINDLSDPDGLRVSFIKTNPLPNAVEGYTLKKEKSVGDWSRVVRHKMPVGHSELMAEVWLQQHRKKKIVEVIAKLDGLLQEQIMQLLHDKRSSDEEAGSLWAACAIIKNSRYQAPFPQTRYDSIHLIIQLQIDCNLLPPDLLSQRPAVQKYSPDSRASTSVLSFDQDEGDRVEVSETVNEQIQPTNRHQPSNSASAAFGSASLERSSRGGSKEEDPILAHKRPSEPHVRVKDASHPELPLPPKGEAGTAGKFEYAACNPFSYATLNEKGLQKLPKEDPISAYAQQGNNLKPTTPLTPKRFDQLADNSKSLDPNLKPKSDKLAHVTAKESSDSAVGHRPAEFESNSPEKSVLQNHKSRDIASMHPKVHVWNSPVPAVPNRTARSTVLRDTVGEDFSSPPPKMNQDPTMVIAPSRRQSPSGGARSQTTTSRRRSTSGGARSRAYASREEAEIAEEAEYYIRRAAERANIGKAYNGATKDWAIVDVPPGTKRVQMDDVGGAGQEITWQRYNGVREVESRERQTPIEHLRAKPISHDNPPSLALGGLVYAPSPHYLMGFQHQAYPQPSYMVNNPYNISRPETLQPHYHEFSYGGRTLTAESPPSSLFEFDDLGEVTQYGPPQIRRDQKREERRNRPKSGRPHSKHYISSKPKVTNVKPAYVEDVTDQEKETWELAPSKEGKKPRTKMILPIEKGVAKEKVEKARPETLPKTPAKQAQERAHRATTIAWEDETRENETRENETRENETRENETRENETRENETRENETQENETLVNNELEQNTSEEASRAEVDDKETGKARVTEERDVEERVEEKARCGAVDPKVTQARNMIRKSESNVARARNVVRRSKSSFFPPHSVQQNSNEKAKDHQIEALLRDWTVFDEVNTKNMSQEEEKRCNEKAPDLLREWTAAFDEHGSLANVASSRDSAGRSRAQISVDFQQDKEAHKAPQRSMTNEQVASQPKDVSEQAMKDMKLELQLLKNEVHRAWDQLGKSEQEKQNNASLIKLGRPVEENITSMTQKPPSLSLRSDDLSALKRISTKSSEILADRSELKSSIDTEFQWNEISGPLRSSGLGLISGPDVTRLGRITEGDPGNFVGRRATASGEVIDEDGDVVGRFDLVPGEAEEEALRLAEEIAKDALPNFTACEELEVGEDSAIGKTSAADLENSKNHKSAASEDDTVSEVPKKNNAPTSTTSTHPPTLSPRTTRRNMLATELTGSLRKHLLFERQQKTLTPRTIQERRQEKSLLQQLPDDPGTGTKAETNSWNPWFNYSLDESNQKGW